MSDAPVNTDLQTTSEATMESDEFIAPDFTECEKCIHLQTQLHDAGEVIADLTTNIAESEKENRSLLINITNQVRTFNAYKKEHNFFNSRHHELNKLRAAVDVLMNLGVPIKDILSPENLELLLAIFNGAIS